MAEGRMLKKEISDSRKIGNLKSDRPRVMYFMMLPHLDKEGRLKADPKIIKGQICTMLPYSQKSIQTSLEQLHDVGLLTLYTVKGNQFVQYIRFLDFQSFNPDREAKSKIPAPSQEDSGVIRRTPLNVREVNVREYSELFDQFWKVFKGRWNVDRSRYDKGSKMEAWEVWQKMNEADKALAFKGAPKTGDKKTKDCCRWLKFRCWET